MSKSDCLYFVNAVATPAGFQKAPEERKLAKLAKLNATPANRRTDSEERARIEFLKADNARMRGILELKDSKERNRIEFLKADNARMRGILERRAQASAEQLMR